MSERWLVVAHEATNSGAPRMLLEVLRGVQAARGPGWSCETLLRRGGPLTGEFARLGPVHLLSHRWAEGATFRAGLFRKFVDRPWVQPRRLAAALARWPSGRFDLVYNNTATNAELVPAVRRVGAPVLTHVHETAYALGKFLTKEALSQTLGNTDHFLAVSPVVAEALLGSGVAAGAITIVPNFLPELPPRPDAGARQAWRARCQLAPEAFVVTGCGHIHEVKGTDLFVEVAAALSAMTARRLSFIWLGGETDVRFARKVRREVRRRNLDGVVRFVGAVAEAKPWFAASDVVAVTSRMESFSLVALEASALGRPVVGFAGARGLAGLLGDQPNLLAPAWDASALASALQALLQDPGAAQAQGLRLRAKVASGFLAAPRIADILSIVDKLQQRRRSRHG